MALPGIGADVVCEERGIVPLCQPVAAALLLVCESLRQIGGRGDLLVEDGPIANGWADHGEAPAGELGDQLVERRARDYGRSRRGLLLVRAVQARSPVAPVCRGPRARTRREISLPELATQPELMDGEEDDQGQGHDTEEPELERAVDAEDQAVDVEANHGGRETPQK